MLKKLLKIGMVAGLLIATSSTLSAQNSQEYCPGGFWSNWSIGVSADFDKQCHGQKLNFGTGTSIGGSIFLEKELNYVWDLRLRVAMPGLYSKDTTKGIAYNLFGLATVGFKFSVNDALMGYDPDRRGSFYLFADAGLGIWQNYNATSYCLSTKNEAKGLPTYHRLNLAIDGGLGYSYKLCEHSTIFAEGEIVAMSHIPNIFKNRRIGLDVMISIGYAYSFGMTEADKTLCAQRKDCNQENIDALNNEISNLTGQVNEGKKRESKLQADVQRLEDELAKARLDGGNDAAAKELRDKIQQIKNDQLTFYALPFSIQYDVNQWTVSSNENKKLEAIARVMKDNPNTKYMIYGFCDYTGSDEYNMKLSQKRAEEVKRLLVNKYGIAENRLEAKWLGKTTAFGDVKYSVNRRVSIYRVIE